MSHTLLTEGEIESLFDKLALPDDPVLFTGGCNQDVQSRPDGSVLMGDSLPGSIELSPGGVARNIAENAARLGLNSSLYAPVGDDSAGRTLLQITSEAGVYTGYCPSFKGKRTCSYAAFLDKRGEMIYAVNDMKLMDEFLPECLDRDVLRNHKNRVVDANLPEQTLEAMSLDGPILLADPVSAHKIGRLKSCLNNTICIKPNRLEAESFCGFALERETDFFKACEVFLNWGCKNIFLSAGRDGFYCMNQKGEVLRMIPPALQPRSVTGAGDAASAALVLAALCDCTLRESAALATLAALSALHCSGAINPELSLTYLRNISKELNL